MIPITLVDVLPEEQEVKYLKALDSSMPSVASTIVQIQRLAFPELMIEIRCFAQV
jgi:hypothetical protein